MCENRKSSTVFIGLHLVGTGLSFCQISGVLDAIISKSGDMRFGKLNGYEVSKFVRIHCGEAMQTISNVLRHVWAFSIAMDGGNKVGTPYLDVRVRFVFRAKLCNLHLMAIPMSIVILVKICLNC